MIKEQPSVLETSSFDRQHEMSNDLSMMKTAKVNQNAEIKAIQEEIEALNRAIRDLRKGFKSNKAKAETNLAGCDENCKRRALKLKDRMDNEI